MRTIEIETAEMQLSELVDAVASGEEVVIERGGKPVAKIVPVGAVPTLPRNLGRLAGKLNVPDNWDDPLPSHVLDSFEGR